METVIGFAHIFFARFKNFLCMYFDFSLWIDLFACVCRFCGVREPLAWCLCRPVARCRQEAQKHPAQGRRAGAHAGGPGRDRGLGTRPRRNGSLPKPHIRRQTEGNRGAAEIPQRGESIFFISPSWVKKFTIFTYNKKILYNILYNK